MAELIELDATQEVYGQYFPNPWLSVPKAPVSSGQGDEAAILFMSNGLILSLQAKWGLVQNWRNYDHAPYYYAAVETISHQWTLFEAFRNRRCIIPATSFSYLREVDGATLRYRLRAAREELLLLGGILEPNVQHSCPSATMALITTKPNRKLSPYGLPVPLVLTKKQVRPWLNPYTDISDVRGFVRPCSRGALLLEITLERRSASAAEQAFSLT
ncbi:MAG: SOS response-associated peptidase family protein [Sterolibacterium sp.]